MKILLDTSAYVGFKRNDVETVEIILRAEPILVSPVVLGELMFGFRNGNRFNDNMNDLTIFWSMKPWSWYQLEKSLQTVIRELLPN